jgi:hypothetical protein
MTALTRYQTDVTNLAAVMHPAAATSKPPCVGYGGSIVPIAALHARFDAPKLAQAEPPDLAVAAQPEQENPVMCYRSRERDHPTSAPVTACTESTTHKTITATGAASIGDVRYHPMWKHQLRLYHCFPEFSPEPI